MKGSWIQWHFLDSRETGEIREELGRRERRKRRKRRREGEEEASRWKVREKHIRERVSSLISGINDNNVENCGVGEDS